MRRPLIKRFCHRLSSVVNLLVHSIRFRLSLWFGVILAVILLVFSLFVYFRQSQDAYDQASARLAVRIAELDRAFIRAFRYDGAGAWLSVAGTSDANAFLLREGEVIVLANQFGSVATFSGPVNQNDAEVLAGIAQSQEPKRHVSIYSLKSGKSSQSSNYLFISTPVTYDGQMVGWVTLGQQMDPDNMLTTLRITLIIAGLVTLVAAMAGGYWLADRALKPVQTITRTAQEISETGLNRRLDIHTQDELGALASTFNQMLDRLQAAFDRQRQFTADASHELRTPLTIIGLETGRVLASGRSIDDYRQALTVIRSENDFMTRLVEELLTLARMDTGRAQMKKEKLDLSDLVLETIERYAPIASQKGISIETGELPELTIQGDRQYLLQMLNNLVDNAIKYTPDGKACPIQIEAGQRLEGSHTTAFVRVTDNGIGIAQEHIPHIFERFYRVDSARSHNQEPGNSENEIQGSGLGLSIVQWIIQSHGGNIQVSSQPGQGTTFEVSLPVYQPAS